MANDPLSEPVRTTITVPWTASLSKNAQWRHRGTRVYTTDAAETAREAVGWQLRAALQGRRFQPRAKIWLEFFVRRNTLKGDPINVVDAMADAVKGAVGIDDNVFAIARLDWELVPDADPSVTLAIWQEAQPIPTPRR